MSIEKEAPATTVGDEGEAVKTCPQPTAKGVVSQGCVTRIRKLHSELEAIGNTALEKVAEAGRLLREAKSELKHGQWLPWLEENFDFSDQTARNWMRLSEGVETGKIKNVLNLSGAYRIGMDSPKQSKPHVSNNSGENEWYTPPEFIKAAREVMGDIDLDPASSAVANQTVGATRFFTKEENGLEREWSGRVWMNPPYAQPLMRHFCEKLAEEFRAGNVTEAVVLTNNATDTGWFHELAVESSAVCLPKGRVRFLDPDGTPGAPLQGQAVLYLGENVGLFRQHFAPLGAMLSAENPDDDLEVEIVEAEPVVVDERNGHRPEPPTSETGWDIARRFIAELDSLPPEMERHGLVTMLGYCNHRLKELEAKGRRATQ